MSEITYPNTYSGYGIVQNGMSVLAASKSGKVVQVLPAEEVLDEHGQAMPEGISESTRTAIIVLKGDRRDSWERSGAIAIVEFASWYALIPNHIRDIRIMMVQEDLIGSDPEYVSRTANALACFCLYNNAGIELDMEKSIFSDEKDIFYYPPMHGTYGPGGKMVIMTPRVPVEVAERIGANMPDERRSELERLYFDCLLHSIDRAMSHSPLGLYSDLVSPDDEQRFIRDASFGMARSDRRAMRFLAKSRKIRASGVFRANFIKDHHSLNYAKQDPMHGRLVKEYDLFCTLKDVWQHMLFDNSSISFYDAYCNERTRDMTLAIGKEYALDVCIRHVLEGKIGISDVVPMPASAVAEIEEMLQADEVCY